MDNAKKKRNANATVYASLSVSSNSQFKWNDHNKIERCLHMCRPTCIFKAYEWNCDELMNVQYAWKIEKPKRRERTKINNIQLLNGYIWVSSAMKLKWTMRNSPTICQRKMCKFNYYVQNMNGWTPSYNVTHFIFWIKWFIAEYVQVAKIQVHLANKINLI